MFDHLTMTATQIPSRTDGPALGAWVSASHWAIEIRSTNGCSLSCQYSRGAAYRVWKPSARTLGPWKGQLPSAPQPGKRIPFHIIPGHSRHTLWQKRAYREHTEPEAPELLDVICSLFMDAEGAEGSFDDWCSDFGENPDSRRALDTYLKCQAIARDLRQLFDSEEEYEAARTAALEI